MDTTPSPVGYMKIDPSLKYECKRYIFKSAFELEDYWCNLFSTCVCTLLGGRQVMVGKEITVDVLDTKPEMQAAIRQKTPEEAELHDDGSVPGDHAGAAGLDSSFFAHLKRNWCSKHLISDSNMQILMKSRTPKLGVAHHPLRLGLQEAPDSFTAFPSTYVTNSSKENSNVTVEVPIETAKRMPVLMKPYPKPFEITRRPKSKTRQVLPRKNLKMKEVLDERDKLLNEQAKQQRKRLSWSPEEEALLMLCKVAGIFLALDNSKPVIKAPVVRDLLHRHVPDSLNKTGKTCMRRMSYLSTRHHTAALDMAMCLEEIKQDQAFVDKFGGLAKRLKRKGLPSERIGAELNVAFVDLVEILRQKYKTHPDEVNSEIKIPDTIKEFLSQFNIIKPTPGLKKRGEYQHVHTLDDIHISVIISTIFSSLSTVADKTNWSLQLFSVFQQYPDQLLREALTKLRADQMITTRKLFAKAIQSKGNQIPLTSTPYQISISYIHLMQTKVQYQVYYEAYTFFDSMMKLGPKLPLKMDSGGKVACIIQGTGAQQIVTEVAIIPPKKDATSTIQSKRDSSVEPPTKRARLENETNRGSQKELVESAENKGLWPDVSQLTLGSFQTTFTLKSDVISELPLSKDFISSFLTNLKRKSIVDGERREWDEVLEVYRNSGATDTDEATAACLVDMILTKKEVGATIEELRDLYYMEPTMPEDMGLAQHLNILTDTCVLLRTGVTTTHYVHWSFRGPWLVHSWRLLRLDRESMCPSTSVAMDVSEQPPPKKTRVYKRKRRGKVNLLEESVETLNIRQCEDDESSSQQVLVMIRPWVRIDGSLNRRVLDRMLGAVLSHCLYNPGCSLKQLQERFSPALQPFYVLELIEILQSLGCVKTWAFSSIQKSTLFSSPETSELVLADGTENEEYIILEPTLDAVLRLSQFIGNKAYSSDFLEDIKPSNMAKFV